MTKLMDKIIFVSVMAMCLMICANCFAASIKYKVIDGDSLERGRSRIRLIDIDAPELFQECYNESKEKYNCGKVAYSVLKMLISKGADCKTKGVDKYKRKLMECFDENGNSINEKMVLSGWAVSYGDKFKRAENIAKEQKSGIWKGKFMRPELYRALHMKQKNSKKFKKR